MLHHLSPCHVQACKVNRKVDFGLTEDTAQVFGRGFQVGGGTVSQNRYHDRWFINPASGFRVHPTAFGRLPRDATVKASHGKLDGRFLALTKVPRKPKVESTPFHRHTSQCGVGYSPA